MTIVYAVAVLGVLAIVFGLILAVAAKVFEVEVDPRLPEIQACLAGANCGGCGYPGCGGCAEAILAGKAPVTACAPAGPENAAKIAAIMGMEAPSGDKMVAHVLCNGGCNAKDNFEYRGVKDCLAATKVCGGDAKACRYGCFGFGSCVAACKFDAIHVENGVARIDYEKCKGCGMCAQKCPKHIILFPLKDDPNPPKPVTKPAAPAAKPAAPAAAPAAKPETKAEVKPETKAE